MDAWFSISTTVDSEDEEEVASRRWSELKEERDRGGEGIKEEEEEEAVLASINDEADTKRKRRGNETLAFLAKQLSAKDCRLSIAKQLSVKDCRLSIAKQLSVKDWQELNWRKR